jgi:hypothetical protein
MKRHRISEVAAGVSVCVVMTVGCALDVRRNAQKAAWGWFWVSLAATVFFAGVVGWIVIDVFNRRQKRRLAAQRPIECEREPTNDWCGACFPVSCKDRTVSRRRVSLRTKDKIRGTTGYNCHAESDEDAIRMCRTFFPEDGWEVVGVDAQPPLAQKR